MAGKTIFIISQQDWGAMFLSKHHYAVELAKMGNSVYFINSPDKEGKLRRGEVVIEETNVDGLKLVWHRLPFPYKLKFRFKHLYYLLIKGHVSNILKKTIKRPDYVWSFDLSNTVPLKAFPDDIYKVFFAADDSDAPSAIEAADTASVIFSIAQEYLKKYEKLNVKQYCLGHGVSENFIVKDVSDKLNSPLVIGLSGNFLRPDLDRKTILVIVDDNPGLNFHFWGSIAYADSNLKGGYDQEAVDFITELKKRPNVILHGQVPVDKLATELAGADAFLICYDIDKDQSKGTNYHKILEYLGTGKVIISNNVSTYSDKPGLVEMPEERNNNSLPMLFQKVIYNITEYNSIPSQLKRIEYAKKHTYKNNINKIEQLVNSAILYDSKKNSTPKN